MITRDHLQVDPQSVRHAAWPAGAAIMGADGMPDPTSGLNSEKKTLEVLTMSPDEFEKKAYQDPDTGEKAMLDVHVGGEHDLAVLKLTGEKFLPLELAPDSSVAAGAKLSLLGFPFGISQTQAKPKVEDVQVARADGGLSLNRTLNPGEPGAPLVTPEGEVVALCSEPDVCIYSSILAKLAP